jgi:uncharacterized membrane-anchored protein YjiN (DUF445 family)
MPTQIVTTEDLYHLKMELLEEFHKIFSKDVHNSKKWLHSAEVRKMLGISAATLQTLRINGTIPYSIVGTLIFYRHDDIVKVLESNMRLNQ